MSKVIRLTWRATLDAGIARRDRSPCVYEAYAPDPLVGRPILLDATVAADVADAELAIARLDTHAVALTNTDALARLLLRAESVASSLIEGLEVGGRRLLRAEAARAIGDDPRDVTADEVLGNIDAMIWSLESLSPDAPITVDHLLEMHRRLLSRTRLSAYAGKIRTEQNWIGGSSYNPCSAQFVPPPPDLVPPLLEDLCAFCNDDSLPAVAQAAIAHAQFETIHPFVDGNGRTGRALIHLILRRRRLATRIFPPISLILATRATDYVNGLSATRHIGAPGSILARAGLNSWIAFFAAACTRATADATTFEDRTRELELGWRARLGKVRANSATDRMLRVLPGAPILTVTGAAALVGRSFQATNDAIAQLVAAGILSPVNVGARRNRAFEAIEVIDGFADLERQLASPEGDTLRSPPARAVPYRR